MATGTEPISEEILNAGDFRILVSTFVMSKEIDDMLRQKHETLQELDNKMRDTFHAFVQELLEEKAVHVYPS